MRNLKNKSIIVFLYGFSVNNCSNYKKLSDKYYLKN
uniref:Uncharacterized protein n=1 Tax=viral metagenome TaxID=1070528 RepID=A0A6C0AEB5_9ZZZZ